MWHHIGNSTLTNVWVGNAFITDIWIGNQLIWHNSQNKLITEDERNIIMNLLGEQGEMLLCVEGNDN